MKYVLMAVVAGTLVACNEGPNNDRMESSPRDDRREADRTYESPEMSDEMNRPINDVHPIENVIPENHQIVNDSVIMPKEQFEGGARSQYDADVLDHDTNRNVHPVMPQSDSPHHSAGSIGTVEGTLPEDHEVQDDGTIVPNATTPQLPAENADPVIIDRPDTGARIDDSGVARDTTYIPITEDGVNQPPGVDEVQNEQSQGERSDEDGRPLTHP